MRRRDRYSEAIRENLVRLRRDRRLTQAALAERAGLARTAVGRIERGQAGPRGATLSKMATALDVPVADLVRPVRRLEAVRLRSRKRFRGRAALLARVSRWLDDYRFLEPERPPCPLLEPSVRFSGAAPEQAAVKARKVIGLDDRSPVRDICGLLENNGIRVLVLHRQSDDFFGLSVGAADGGPAVVVNAWERIAVERWIFSAAHELGHLLLHPGDFVGAATDESRRSEREADRFASAFLMPEAAFTVAWNQTCGHDLITRVLKVKRLFRVSYRTVLHRLVATNRASDKLWVHFQVEVRARTGKTLRKSDEPLPLQQSAFAGNWRRSREPARLEHHDFIEDRMARLVRTAVETNRITMSRAAEILDLDLTQMLARSRTWTN